MIVPTAQDRPPEKGTEMAWRILITRNHLENKVYDPPSEDQFMYDSVEDRMANKHIDFPYSRAFKAYDDDGILYFSGRLEWDSNSGSAPSETNKYDGPDEETLYDVYKHFVYGYGATSVRYHNKPGWLIG